VVLATVRGDVHDIGKNLVDIILTNNGYRVINLGIKQPISAILEAAVEHKAHAVGMSGLLVKSTVVMRENLDEMSRQGLELPSMQPREGSAGRVRLGRKSVSIGSHWPRRWRERWIRTFGSRSPKPLLEGPVIMGEGTGS
jgi:hypothetical protein